MLLKIPDIVRIPLVALLIAINTVLHTTPLIIVAFIKVLVPIAGFRRGCNWLLVSLAEAWIGANSLMIDHFTATTLRIDGNKGLRHDGHYLVLANHQSWVDIAVLQKVFNRRIPFLRFFLKAELIWVPFLGLAWWALDFPFMRRYSKQLLTNHPELAGKDIIATRRACEKFKGMPVSVMNFVEGTRFTEEKHEQQSSPHRHLLRPKAGGVAFVLNAMGSGLHSILDVTIVYPGGKPTMLDLIGNRIPEVRVEIRQRAIPESFSAGDYEGDPRSAKYFQGWMNSLWREKDEVITRMLSE